MVLMWCLTMGFDNTALTEGHGPSNPEIYLMWSVGMGAVRWPGGDSANVFDLYQGAVKDISLNEATKRLNFLLQKLQITHPNHFGD